jgi:FXSXX-COOH protein
MVLTEELRPAYASAMPDLHDIPLAETSALGPDVVRITIGRVLAAASTKPVLVAAFQSSI